MVTDANCTVTYRGLRLDVARARLHLYGSTLQLRPTEAKLLGALLSAPKWVITYDDLAAELPDGDLDADCRRAIQAHFSRLAAVLRLPLERTTGVSCRRGSADFVWENIRSTGYGINGRWPGWSRLEALATPATTAADSGVADTPPAHAAERSAGKAALAHVEVSGCPDVTAPSSAEASAAGSGLPPATAEPPAQDGPDAQPQRAAPRFTFPRPHWRGRRIGLPALVLPLGIVAGMFSFGVAHQANWSPAAGGYQVEMTSPISEAAPGTFLRITGTTSNVPNCAPLWLVVASGDSYWPQQRVARKDGTWFGYARIGDSPADSGIELAVLAVLVDSQVDQEFETWLGRGNRIRQYPPYPVLPTGTHVAAQTTVRITASTP